MSHPRNSATTRFFRRRAGSGSWMSCARAMMSSIARPNRYSGEESTCPVAVAVNAATVFSSSSDDEGDMWRSKTSRMCGMMRSMLVCSSCTM